MKAKKQDLAALVEKMPELDKRGTLTGPRRTVARRTYDTILAGGEKNIAGLVDMLKDKEEVADWKARYVIHGMAHYLCGPDKKKEQATFLRGLASKLGDGTPKPVQGYVIRQLQVVGDASVLEALGKALLDADLYEDAAQALLAIGGGGGLFRAALPKSTGKARVCFVQALGILRDTGSVETIRKDAAGTGQLRLTALWALANIGDPGAVDLVIRAADGTKDYDRIKATKACLLLAENLIASGKKDGARKIYGHLKETRKDPSEDYISNIAAEALAGIGK